MEAIHQNQDHQALQTNTKYLGKNRKKWKRKQGKTRNSKNKKTCQTLNNIINIFLGGKKKNYARMKKKRKD